MNRSIDTTTHDDLRLQIVRTGDGLAAIEAAWSRLWTEVDGLVFQNPLWVAAWWNTIPPGSHYKLRIGLIWRGKELRAVLPLVISRHKGLRFLEWAAITCTDYPDVLAAADCPLEKLRELWAAVLAEGGFDLVRITRLLPDARARAVIASSRGGFQLQPGHRHEVSCRVLGDFSGEGGWLAQQSKKARQNYRRGRKVLEEGNATVRFRLIDAAAEPIGPIIDRFYGLKRKWMSDTDRQSELLDTDGKAVHALIRVLDALGLLRVFVLERNAETVAISINFEQHGTMMAFLTTFDPAYEKASPGAVLIVDYIQWSADHGLKIIDFLSGGEAFKFRFSTATVVLETLVGARTLLGHAALLANKLRLHFRRPEVDEAELTDGAQNEQPVTAA